MKLEAPHTGDEVIRREEAPLLAVDGQVAGHLADLVVDYQGPEPYMNGQQHAKGFVLRSQRGQL
jgi:hypothetical protein